VGFRRSIKRLERMSRGELIPIRQADGSTKRFSQRDFANCFIRNLDQMLAETASEKPEAHPLQLALLNAARWKPSYEVYTDGLRREPTAVCNVVEPHHHCTGLTSRPAQTFMRSRCAQINLTAAAAVAVEDSYRKLAATVRA
jgi:hypothetical protein